MKYTGTLPPMCPPPPRGPAVCAEHSIFDDTHGLAPVSGDGTSTLDLDGEPTHKIVEIHADDIEVVVHFDGESTQPLPPMPVHWSELPVGTVHDGHFNTDGWVS